MAGYLDQYGAGDERRARTVKRIVVMVVCVVVFTFLPWYLFKNHSQERVVRNFLDLVRKHDYQSAYKAWGCGEPRACEGYSYDRFLEDWGEKSPVDPKVLRIEDSESCGSGVMLTVRTSRDRLDTLWVEKSNSALSFAPPSITVCPTKSFWAMFAHLTLGKLRKPFLN
jgi:hypothetical protein